MSRPLVNPHTLFTPEKIAKLKVQERALELRSRGWDWEEVRAELKVPTIAQVQHMVKRALDRRIAMPVEDLRRGEDRKLDKIEREMGKILMADAIVYKRDQNGAFLLDSDGEKIPCRDTRGAPVREEKTGQRVAAAEVILKVMDRRAKLRGLDAPSKVAQTNAAGEDLAAGALRNFDQKTVQELAQNIVQQMAHKVEMDKRIKDITPQQPTLPMKRDIDVIDMEAEDGSHDG